MKRVGINLLYLVPGEVGGSETAARASLAALRTVAPDLEAVVYCGPEAIDSLAAEPWANGWRFVTSPVKSRSKAARIAGELSWLPTRARRDGIELLHSMGTTNPLLAPVPTVVSVLDLIYHHYPETFPRSARLGLEFLVPAGARRARRVVAISHAGKRDIVETLRIPSEKVDVVPLGYGLPSVETPTREDEIRRRWDLPGRVVMTVSPALRHKNLARLIGAFGRLAQDFPDLALVIAGHPGLEREALRQQARAMGLDGRVVFTGWLPEADLEGLYRMADVFAYPSLMEGFGIPVLEAMARDVPVACSGTSSLPEVAGDAAEFFDPSSEEAIASAVRKLLVDEAVRNELIRRGRARVQAFPWENTARGLLAVYERAST